MNTNEAIELMKDENKITNEILGHIEPALPLHFTVPYELENQSSFLATYETLTDKTLLVTIH